LRYRGIKGVNNLLVLGRCLEQYLNRKIINLLLSNKVHGCLKEYQGTFDKFIGDAIMLLYGAPHSLDQRANKAYQCAIESLVS